MPAPSESACGPALPAPPTGTWRHWGLAIGWLLLASFCIGDFGPVWDSAELWTGDQVLSFLAHPLAFGFDPEHAPAFAHSAPALAFDGRFPWTHVGVLSATIAAITCWLFHDLLGWASAMEGYLVATLLFAAAMLVAFARFGERHLGRGIGCGAAALLLLQPRWFTEALGNTKDLPECALFTLAVLAGHRALTSARLADWVWCAVFTGLATAQKPNGAFVPVLLLPFVVQAWSRRRGNGTFRAPRPGHLAIAVGAALLALLFGLPHAWHDPIAGVHERLATQAALGRQTVLTGGADAEPFWLTAWHVAIATPTTVLVAAAVGACAPMTPSLRWFLLTWATLPIARTLLPGMRHYDGIRHVLESLVPLSLLATIGAAWLLRALRARGFAWGALGAVGAALPFADAGWGTISVYPYGTCYFAPLAGGLAGAQARGERDATDYWCTSYWATASWLSQHAEPAAGVLVGVARHVMRTLAPLRLRADLRMLEEEAEIENGIVYVVNATRDLHYPRWLHEMRQLLPPVHTIMVQGGAILEVRRLDPHRDAAATALWRHQRAARAMGATLWRELEARDPAQLAPFFGILQNAFRYSEVEAFRQLRSLFPGRDDADFRLCLWPYLPAGS